MAIEDVKIVGLSSRARFGAVANSALERQTIEAEIVRVKAEPSPRSRRSTEGKAAAMHIMARAGADRIKTRSDALAARARRCSSRRPSA